jgi:hypothetical protein
MDRVRSSQTEIPITGVAPAAPDATPKPLPAAVRVLTPLSVDAFGEAESMPPASLANRVAMRASGVVRAVSAESMAVCLGDLRRLDGCLGVAIVDVLASEVLGTRDANESVEFVSAAVAYIEVFRALRNALREQGDTEVAEDTMVTTADHVYLLRASRAYPSLVFFIMLDRARCNVVLARNALARVANVLA